MALDYEFIWKINMNKFLINQSGIAHIALIMLLLGGIVVGTYLVKQKQIFRPKAYEGETYIKLQAQAQCGENGANPISIIKMGWVVSPYSSHTEVIRDGAVIADIPNGPTLYVEFNDVNVTPGQAYSYLIHNIGINFDWRSDNYPMNATAIACDGSGQGQAGNTPQPPYSKLADGYSCQTDNDCNSGSICTFACDNPAGRCPTSRCLPPNELVIANRVTQPAAVAAPAPTTAPVQALDFASWLASQTSNGMSYAARLENLKQTQNDAAYFELRQQYEVEYQTYLNKINQVNSAQSNDAKRAAELAAASQPPPASGSNLGAEAGWQRENQFFASSNDFLNQTVAPLSVNEEGHVVATLLDLQSNNTSTSPLAAGNPFQGNEITSDQAKNVFSGFAASQF